jgi:hypothetical protein
MPLQPPREGPARLRQVHMPASILAELARPMVIAGKMMWDDIVNPNGSARVPVRSGRTCFLFQYLRQLHLWSVLRRRRAALLGRTDDRCCHGAVRRCRPPPTRPWRSEGLVERRLSSCPSLTMLSAALPLPAAGIVAAASPAVLALMKSRLFIGPPFVFVAKRPSWFTAR